MQDITSTLEDINPTDRVFEHEGKFVKVRVLAVEPPPGSPSFGVAFLQVSGAETNAEGRAIKHGEGWRIAAAERKTVQYDEAVDLDHLFNSIREETVLKTLNASAVQAKLEQLLGQ